MVMAARVSTDSKPCPPTGCKHTLTCARCPVSDQTVAVTTTRDGATWPPLCSSCAARVHRQTKDSRIAAVERAVARG
jgi:hypothetical protein